MFSHLQILDVSKLDQAIVNKRGTKYAINFDCECFFIFPIFRLLVYGACRSQQVNVGKWKTCMTGKHFLLVVHYDGSVTKVSTGAFSFLRS